MNPNTSGPGCCNSINREFTEPWPHRLFGSFIGGRLLGLVPSTVLLPLLAIILGLSAVKVWRHR
jgi:hypothetical protein